MQEKTIPIETETKTLFWGFKRAMTENEDDVAESFSL